MRNLTNMGVILGNDRFITQIEAQLNAKFNQNQKVMIEIEVFNQQKKIK